MTMLFILLQLLGTWTRSDGSVETVPCPTAEAFSDPQSVIRLPVGCPVLGPRVGYTVEQDAKVRAELTMLRTQAPMLLDEVARGRAACDTMVNDLKSQLKVEQQEHEKALAEAAAAEGREAQAQAQLVDRSILLGAVGVAVGAVATLYLTR